MTDIDETHTTEPVSKYTADDWQRAINERRRAIMRLDVERITHILQLPDGVRIRGVQANWELDAVDVMVEGPTLDATVPDTHLPRLVGDMEYDDVQQRLIYLPWKPEGAA